MDPTGGVSWGATIPWNNVNNHQTTILQEEIDESVSKESKPLEQFELSKAYLANDELDKAQKKLKDLSYLQLNEEERRVAYDLATQLGLAYIEKDQFGEGEACF